MIKIFDEFKNKFKFIFNLNTNKDIADALDIKTSTFASMQKRDEIPFEQVIKYCEDRAVDLNWVINLKKNR